MENGDTRLINQIIKDQVETNQTNLNSQKELEATQVNKIKNEDSVDTIEEKETQSIDYKTNLSRAKYNYQTTGNPTPKAYQPPQSGFVPAYYPNSYYQLHYAPTKPRPHVALIIAFWIFYALVGFWLDLSLNITLWATAFSLTAVLPLVAMQLNGWFPSEWNRGSNWIFEQNTPVVYGLASSITVVGVLLLVVGVLTFKPWVKLHLWLFRELGGVKF